jgi:hypothetical protein
MEGIVMGFRIVGTSSVTSMAGKSSLTAEQAFERLSQAPQGKNSKFEAVNEETGEHYDKAALKRLIARRVSSMPKGPRGEKRPPDVIGAAIMAAKIATGEITETAPKPSAAAELGKKGGQARAATLK